MPCNDLLSQINGYRFGYTGAVEHLVATAHHAEHSGHPRPTNPLGQTPGRYSSSDVKPPGLIRDAEVAERQFQPFRERGVTAATLRDWHLAWCATRWCSQPPLRPMPGRTRHFAPISLGSVEARMPGSSS